MNAIEQTEEFEAWLDGLGNLIAKKAIAREIVKMEGGLFGDTKHIDGPVWEKRLDMGPGYRLYFMRRGSVVYLLLMGGTKRTQKKDIERAKELAAGL